MRWYVFGELLGAVLVVIGYLLYIQGYKTSGMLEWGGFLWALFSVIDCLHILSEQPGIQ
jgi:hypothetical protein